MNLSITPESIQCLRAESYSTLTCKSFTFRRDRLTIDARSRCCSRLHASKQGCWTANTVPKKHIGFGAVSTSHTSWRHRAVCTQAAPVHLSPVLGELAEGLETPVQLIYLVSLLGFLVVGAYLVVRQVLIRRELEEAAKKLGDRIRSGSATSEECFELGVILLRKKLFTQAVKNLEKAKRSWDGEPEELAQVHNALGFAYFNMDKPQMAIENYQKAVDLQPGYVTAWNNLGDAFEKASDWKGAYNAYSEALSYAPDNRIARERSDALRTRAQRASG